MRFYERGNENRPKGVMFGRPHRIGKNSGAKIRCRYDARHEAVGRGAQRHAPRAKLVFSGGADSRRAETGMTGTSISFNTARDQHLFGRGAEAIAGA